MNGETEGAGEETVEACLKVGYYPSIHLWTLKKATEGLNISYEMTESRTEYRPVTNRQHYCCISVSEVDLRHTVFSLYFRLQ
jgi:hypothetical protein